ncbi:MAG TPA: hydrogenase 4 subunit B [Bacteroidota bacterium]|nr:hydrogenase 4 subunit B [Bacteroidota bacterium]
MEDLLTLELGQFLLYLMFGSYAAGAAIGLLLAPRKNLSNARVYSTAKLGRNLSLGLSLIGSLSGVIVSLLTLGADVPLIVQIPGNLHWGKFAFELDKLSSFFVMTISLLGVAVSLYSFQYVSSMFQKRHLGVFLFLYNTFLLSMVGVSTAGNAILFLIIWEGMSLTTYFLITFEHEQAASRRAGFLYIAMTHIGTAFLLIMFLLLFSGSGSFDFDSMRSSGSTLPESIRSTIFLCALVGFGIKAGIIPLHIWLPEAHPAAPTNISALMSGVMIKMGIYGMVRVFFDFLGPGPQWWGIVLIIVAVVSAVLGVLYALMEHDLKRLLAFHSIENIGIIMLGVGGAVLFNSVGNRPLAALALVAGLYHVLNHAIFKGLLFLGAGSVIHATHTRNIEELGGLIKKLPYTSLFFLIGAASISALPPLNGFVSEWLTFQALLFGFGTPNLAVKIAIPMAAALLALTGALAAACFVKAFGITFLGLPRTLHAERAQEAPHTMLVAMGILAAGCVVFGLWPGFLLGILMPLSGSLLGTSASIPVVYSGSVLSLPFGAGTSMSTLTVAALLLVLFGIAIFAGFVLKGRLVRREAPTWACGLEAISPRLQYTAAGFSKPIRMIFSSVLRATHEIEVSEDVSPYFQPRIRFELRTESVFEQYLYRPVLNFVLRGARAIRQIQTGHIQSYLAYIFIALIILLWLTRWATS